MQNNKILFVYMWVEIEFYVMNYVKRLDLDFKYKFHKLFHFKYFVTKEILVNLHKILKLH